MRRNPTRPLNVLASAAAVADAEMAAATAGRPVSHRLIFPHHGTFAEDPVNPGSQLPKSLATQPLPQIQTPCSTGQSARADSQADGKITIRQLERITARLAPELEATRRERDAIVRALTHQDRDHVLKQTAELAQRGAVADAYAAWKLPGLRAPFFTKWLWAASSLTPQSCCLIQDKRVWNSLRALGWDSLRASGQRDWPSRYAAYVADVHECARQIGNGVSAEESNTRCSGSTATPTSYNRGSCDLEECQFSRRRRSR